LFHDAANAADTPAGALRDVCDGTPISDLCLSVGLVQAENRIVRRERERFPFCGVLRLLFV
jgi:hypothetical protein